MKQGERDYTRQVYQNLMAVVELLENKSPMPVGHKQIQEAIGLSKNIIFDVCWNLCKRGWAEDVGDGNIKVKNRGSDIDAAIGKEVIKIVKNYVRCT